MLDFLQYPFLQRALLAAILISITAPLVGAFLVVRRYALISDTLAHVSLLGTAIGLALGISPTISALVLTGGCALGIEQIRTRLHISGDALLSALLSGSLGLALLILSTLKNTNISLINYLFGSINTVSWSDLQLMGLLTFAVIGCTIFFFQSWLNLSFSPELSRVLHYPVRTLETIFMLLVSLVIVLSLQMVGVLLVGSLMVLPVLTALRLTRSFRQMVLVAVVCSLMASLIGLWLSYHWNLPTSSLIVLTNLGFLILSLIVQRWRT